MNADAHIVVGYDGKPGSIAALSWAAKLASLRGEAIVAATVIDPRLTPRGMAWPEAYWIDIEDKAREVLAAGPEVSFTAKRYTGHLVPKLLEAAEGSSMLVVGSKGHGLVREILRGSVSQSAARNASVPVVVIREAQNPASGRIVVGADGTESSARALEFACELAQLTGDKIVALRAWHPAAVVADRYGYAPPPSAETLDAAEGVLGRTVDALRQAHPDIPIETELFRGPAERGLIDASDNASLVVVGSRGRSAVEETFLGSVSRAVLHKAHSPVAVLH
jgi:nucleotide-binding universal stress UspA family protein